MTIAINPSNNQDIDGLLWGYAWGDGGPETLTFSFPTSAAAYTGYTAINGFSSFNTAQADAVRDVLANVASFCNLTFIETAAPGAELRYAEATSTQVGTVLFPVTTAYAFYPQPGIPMDVQGDSWFHISNYDFPVTGAREYKTILHETGHMLGLKHGHETETSHGVTFPTLPADHDSYEYSVMTYRQFPGDNPLNGTNAPDHPTTYMQDDIVALQYLYGANYGPSAHNGNTVYTWSPVTGEASIDGIGQGVPANNVVFMTIWDGGGIDTYDFSNYGTNLSVNLNPGAWTILDTSADHYQRANLGDNGAGGPEYFARGNIANAQVDPNNPSETLSLIENAVGGYGNDFILGNGIGNVLSGNDGHDSLSGYESNDALFGGNGNDSLDGGTGADVMEGGDGDDFYVVDNVGDLAVEVSIEIGSGYDTVQSSVSYTLLAGSESLILTGGAAAGTGNSLNNLIAGTNASNSLYGLAGNDILNGFSGNDTLDGGSGADTMDGGDGNDFYDVDNVGDVAAESSSSVGSGDDTVQSSVSYTLGVGIETLILTGGAAAGRGNDLNNLIAATNADNSLHGLAGNDILNGFSGNDTLDGGSGADTMDGGFGNDVYTVDNANDVVVELDGYDTVQSFISYTLGSEIEQLILLGTGPTNGTGNGNNNVITGNSGTNVLEGLAGDDLLNGGAGTDTVSYESAAVGVTVNLATTTAQNTVGAGTDTLSNFENLKGSNFNDTLTGNSGSNLLIGGLGNDILNGGAGVDTASYETATVGVTVNLGLTTAQNTVGAGADTLSNLEHLTGSNFNDFLSGNSANNTLSGLAGNDTLNGLDGNDTLLGGTGNDILNGGVGTDIVSYETATTGVTVNLSLTTAQNTIGAGSDTLSNFENIRGSNFNDTLTGNTGSNLLIGGLGNDILNGGTGTDTVSYETASAGVTVSLLLTTVQNTVGAGTDTLSNFENLKGSNSNDTLTGNTGSNLIIGGLGNDLLNGGTGTDTASYETASTGVTVNLGLTTAQNTVGAGTDTLSNFENLTGSNLNDTLTGNAGSNLIIGGLGNDSLNGSTGIDTVSYETASIGVTVSLLLAAAQNTVGAGTDTLSNFENLTGSNLNDTLTGNAGNNVLSGLAGNDTLAGGLGNDQLNGGDGQDKFVFNTALNATTNKDTITGFSSVDDQLVLENAIFTKFTATGAIPAGTFVSGAGAVALDTNDYLIYNTTTGTLSYDADGNGASAAVAFVTLLGNPILTSADFTII